MLQPRVIAAVLLAVAGLAACSHEAAADPCAYGTPGAQWLAYASDETGSWDVLAMRVDGSCLRTIAGGPSTDGHPAWAPGGLLAYDSTHAPLQSVWIHVLDTGVERRLDLGNLAAAAPAFSPDGHTLAFEGRFVGSTATSVYVVPVAGGAPVELTPEPIPHTNGGPVFSPDGAEVFFVSNRNGPWDVFVVPATGGAAVQVTTGSGIVGKPTISPDGRTLAFARSTAASSEVVVYDRGTGTTTPLGIANAAEPAFDPTPGASRLATSVLHGFYPTIDLVPVSGAGSTRLTFGPGPDGAPALAPLGH